MDYDKFQKELEQMGPDEVRVRLAMDMIAPGHERDVAQTWLLRKEATLAYQADGLKNILQSAQLAATSRAAEAADRAAAASERQAASAERSARISGVALFVAIAAAIISLVAIAKSH